MDSLFDFQFVFAAIPYENRLEHFFCDLGAVVMTSGSAGRGHSGFQQARAADQAILVAGWPTQVRHDPHHELAHGWSLTDE
jgi:hypothetical protein